MNTGKPLYPLSESQKSIWYLEKAYPGTSLNIIAGTLRFKGSVDFSVLEKALNLFVRNNDAIRIRLVEEDGAPKQYVADFESRNFDFLDFGRGGGLKDLFIWDGAQTRIPFDIINQELFYCALFKISDEEGGFYMKMHHLISDAWTMGLVVKHVVNYYTLIMNGWNEEGAPSPSFIEHILNEAEYETSGRFIKDRNYWNAKFDTLPELTLLKPQKANSIAAKRKTMLTPLKLSNKIREFCKATHLSIFMLFMSALAIYINRVTGQDDIVLGTTILNRANMKEKETAGMFVSVAAPLRISVNDTMNFKTFASAMLKENTDVLRHQRYPYNYLIRDLKKKHKFSNRLFDIVLSYQNLKFSKKEGEPDYTARWLFSGCQVESLIISINDREDEGNLIIDYDFLTDVFNLKEIEFIHQRIISLLWHALDNPLRSISKLEMISEREKRTILHEFNNTDADYPRGKTIHGIFEEQAGKNPGSVALVFKDRTMTYQELNGRANRLARVLRKNGVGPDKAVGIMTRRSFELIVGIMGILKAGGAYLPIDPDYPADRKLYMLDNSNAEILLTGRGTFGSVNFDGMTLDLEDERSYDADGSNLPGVNSAGDLAYIIYTSGSTGMPKGVMIEHTGVVNSCSWGQKRFSLDENSIVLQKTAATFDPSVWEIFWWLMLGGKICLIESGDEKDPEAIISAIDTHKVTAMHFVPSMMSIFLNYVENTSSVKRLASLKQVFSCGEALSVSQMEHFNRLLGAENGTKLFNMYGPTEATVEVACFDCSSGVTLSSVPIGERIDNFKIFILDRNKNLLPVGIPGEIYISGAGVARGYLNNAELTSERFVENPFLPGEIMYRTGDRARWYPKGDIEFLGRMDYQVKIKGFRIELGEIEARLISHDLISEAAVKAEADENGNAFLAAYVVAGEISREEIRAYLASALPDYMVPSCFTFLDRMPLNSNGKADRNALPKPVFTVNSIQEYEAPVNETERILAGIWGRVLGLDRVGVTEDYALLGGDSLNAIRIINEIYKQFGVELSPKYIFQLQTVRRLAEHVSSVSKRAGGFRHIPRIEDSAYYRVSSAQKRQYILNRIDSGVSYNLPGGMLLEGDIDTGKVKEIFSRLVERHESLRTSFEIRDGEPVQIVHPSVDFSIEYRQAEEKDYGQLMEDFIRPFDLEAAPLFRAGLITVAENRHYLLFDMHHIISDGASINIIIREFVRLYNGHEPEPPAVRYRDYSAWHNQLLQSDKMKQQEAFWLGKFSDEIPLLNMPLDFVRPSVQSFRGNRLYFHIDRKLTAKIKKLAADSGATLFMLLLSAYNVLLSKYTGQEDIVVGTPVEGRNHSDLRGVVGMFVNTLAIRSRPASEKTFADFLGDVKEEMLNIFENQEYPFEELVEKAGVKRDISRNPLFDTTFVLQVMDLSKVEAGKLNIAPYAFNNKTSKFDLALEAFDLGDTIDYNFEYSTDLFREETMRRISAHFINVLEDIAGHPSKKLSDISLLSEEERRRLLCVFNDTDADYPRDMTIHQLFEKQVKKNPEHTALILRDKKMTYRELNDRANRLARTLRENGVGPDDIVGIIVNRSFDMIIGIMGVLKAGGAYLPVDPDFPAERIGHMLGNSGAKLLLTQRELTDRVTFEGGIMLLDDESCYSADASDLANVNQPSQLAYIIYTSGSTGKPKGVATEHRNIVGLFFNDRFQYEFYQTDRWLQFHSYCFDFSSFEIYGALLFGGTLVLLPKGMASDLAQVRRILSDGKITVLCQTPQSFYNFSEIEMQSEQAELSVRYFILGGESLKPALLSPMKNRYPSTKFINIYGPTETTILVTQKEIGFPDIEENISNIGKPNPLVKAFVMDKHYHLVPVGVTGELYISGNGLSRGYINNEELTKERFVQHPLLAGELMYKTGDLVRFLPSGDLQYISRADNQVKIRGYRIELGEIEAQLLNLPEVSDAVVVTREDSTGNKRLAAYFVSERDYSPAEMRSALSRTLPGYMLPSSFMRVGLIPMNSNGKVDQRSLPEPEAVQEKEYAAPVTAVETNLTEIWGRVLGRDKIGTHDNFFNLGGDSLNAVAVTSQIHKALDVEISPRDIFKFQTIRELGAYIEAQEKSSFASIAKVEKSPYYPVSSAQKRQFILWQLEGLSTSYNVPFGIILVGKTERGQIERILKTIIERHESLCTSFEMRDGEPVQIIHDHVDFSLSFREDPNPDYDKAFETFTKPFDLGSAPLLRGELIRAASEEHILLLDMHHIITDGESMNVFIREFMDLLNGGRLPELKIQYKDYSAWHNALLKTEKIKKQEAYWLNRFAGEIPVLNMPVDFARPSFQSFNGARMDFCVDEALTAELKSMAAKTGTTLFMLLFSAYNILLSKYTGQEDIVVGTPVEGRRHAELRDIIGMFVNTLAIRSHPSGEKTFSGFLEEVKENLLEAYEHQEYPFEELVEKAGVKRDFSRNPLFDASFSLRNTLLSGFEVRGISASLITGGSRTAKFDLLLEAADQGNVLDFSLEYCTDLFAEETMERLTAHFVNLLKDIVSAPEKLLSEMSILSEEERHRLLYEFNDTDAEYPRDKTVQQLFEEQAERTPDNIALVFHDREMTYAELNAKANGLARTLRDIGVGPDDIVGVLARRSFDLFIAILGVLKAGGAYLPIDPDYPGERIKYMLENSEAKVLVTRQALIETISFNGVVMELDNAACYSPDTSRLPLINKPSDLAYVIYTSGSTGRPKGTMISHRSVVNFCFQNSRNVYGGIISPDISRIVSVTTVSFDIFVTESLLPLQNGLTVILADETEQNQQNRLGSLVIKHRAEVLQTTPSKMSLLISDQDQLEYLSVLKVIILGGEVFPQSLYSRLTSLTSARIYNIFGPTETTVWSTYAQLITDVITIGKPIANTRIYILDQYLNPLPAGIPGELYIGGEGVSCGYYGSPDTTKERFIQIPSLHSGKLYKTGDLAYWTKSGSLVYIGRNDFQVKLRGLRIELGEIEARLMMHVSVNSAVVKGFFHDSGASFLCAYITSEHDVDETEIRGYLAEYLPEYMVPAYFVQVDELPMTANGKIDRSALPAPDSAGLNRAEYAAPETDVEMKLCEIWSTVLKLEKIGATDEYSLIGGDSLNAIRIILEVQKIFDVEIVPRDIFSRQTIRELGKHIGTLQKVYMESIPKAEERACYPVSSAQKRQFLLRQIEGSGIAYNMPSGLILEGQADLARIERIFNMIISRHEQLRTSFEMRDGEPVQLIHDNVEFKVSFRNAPGINPEQAMADFVKPFDFSAAPLLRADLIRISGDKQVLLTDMHHIISDGASLNILVKEFTELYCGERLPELKIQYKDYSAWHNALLKTEKIKKQEAYWLNRFAGEIPVLNMPVDFARPSFQSFSGARMDFCVDEALTAELKSMAAKTGTTLFMLLFTAYNVLLSKYTGQEDIVVGTPVEGRRHAELRDIIGMFVNTLAIRSYPSGEKTFSGFLEEVKENLLEAYEHQEYPFEELVEKAGVKRDFSRNPLFDTVFSLHSEVPSSFSMGELSASLMKGAGRAAKFDITLEAIDQGNVLDFGLEYCTALFTEETMERLAAHFVNTLKEIVSKPEKPLSEISILSGAERSRLLCEFNDTDAEYPRDKTLHQLFEEQAKRTPDSVALIFENREMTYAELNRKANKLAHTLRERGVLPDDIVGIITGRSFDMLVAVFGVLKAGAAYMPIDPEYPEERIKYMLENSGARVLLTQHALTEDLPFDGTVIDIAGEACSSADASNPAPVNKSSDLAYIIYTSGSTGRPKGVMIEHRNVVRLLFNTKFQFDFGREDVWTMFHSYCFDFSVWEMYGALLYGGKLIVLSKDEAKDTRRFLNLLKSEKVTVLNQTPSAFYNLIKEDEQNRADISKLRYVIFGGEALKPPALSSFKEKYPGTKLINMYGITETTVHVTFKEITYADTKRNVSNIGRPIPTLKVFITDQNMNLQPVGVPGEICVGGDGVGRGYLNNHELTKEKFVKIASLSDGAVYRSGDLGRLLPGGDIEYLGRIDSQVKIRGFRIELGEIEQIVLTHPAVQEAVITANENNSGDKKLCVYYKSKTELANGELKTYLASKLPDYMIPAYFIKVEYFPLNRNGKTDIGGLPKPSERDTVRLKKTPPRNLSEEIMAEVWAEVLDLPQIGIDDNFFDIGGDSLSAIKVISKLNMNIAMVDFYKNATIRQLSDAAYVSMDKKLLVHLTPGDRTSGTNLICFPYGGGSAIAYRDVSRVFSQLEKNVNVYSVNLPGHEYGVAEEPEDIDTVAQRLAGEIRGLGGDIILYSHCVGSALLMATARLLDQEDIPVRAAFIGAVLPPRKMKFFGKFHTPWRLYSDRRIIKYLLKIGLPKEVLAEKSYMKQILKAFRHDTKCFWEYYQGFEQGSKPLNIPLYCIYGDKDPATVHFEKAYIEWNKHFSSVHLLVIKNAAHYFINSNPEELAGYISIALHELPKEVACR